MIPKIIHYCWFGGNELPLLAKKCIESWKKYLPDYEIIEWNENNFDVNIIQYTKEAYKARKYAFVSDYARFWILYKYGGIYFDTDVEVIKPMDKVLSCGPYMGFEHEKTGVAPGLGMASGKGNNLIAYLLEAYKNRTFYKSDGSTDLTTIVTITTELLKQHGLKLDNTIQKIEDYTIYPSEYFCPVSIHDGKLRITDKTYTIHHYAQSWESPIHKYLRKIVLKLGGGALKDFLVRITGYRKNRY